MEELTMNLLANYGVLGLIAVVFFRGYFEDKKKAYEFNEKVLAFQERMGAILNDSTTTIQGNHTIIKDTKAMHDLMDKKIDEIMKKMATAENQVEIIKAVNELRRAWEEFNK